MNTLLGILLMLLSYIIGSLPFGFWIGKLSKGSNFDIRDHSENIFDFFRVLGWKASVIVFSADLLKGYIPAYFAAHLLGDGWGVACLLFAMGGHAYSIVFYLMEGVFSGGRSVTTLFGGLIALQPLVACLGFGIFLVVLLVTQYLSMASILACTFVTVLAFVLNFGMLWLVMFLSVTLLILYTHRRSIARLIEGIEPKFGHSGIVNGSTEVVTAFAIHSLTTDDLRQLNLTAIIPKLMDQGRLSKKDALWLIANAKVVLEVGEIIGIETKIGKNVRVLILGIALLPDQIKCNLPKLMKPIEALTFEEREQYDEALQIEQKRKELLEGLLRSALIQAQRRGAKILGLGALLSSESRGGADLQRYADQRHLTIKVDNGAAFTASATITALERECPIPLKNAKVVVIGAYGLIGNLIIRHLRNRVNSIIAIGRDHKKLKDVEGENIRTMIFSEMLDRSGEISQADVIVLCTSSEKPIITKQNIGIFKPGTLILDVAIPPDFDEDALLLRPDIKKLIRCGLVLLPGRPESGIDFHFGRVKIKGDWRLLVPACLAQSILLALSTPEEIAEHASLGARIFEESLEFFREKAEEHGFEIVTSEISEPALYSALMRQ